MYVLLVAILICSCQKEQSDSIDTPIEQEEKIVLTPYGNLPASRIIALDYKTTVKIRNGRIFKIDIATDKVIADLGKTSSPSKDPYTFGRSAAKTGASSPGFIATAYASDIQAFSTKWVVPGVPPNPYSTATTFLWNGIDRGTLQPVLMWGGTAGGAFYAIANWCYLDGVYLHGKYVSVLPGTVLEGVVSFVSHDESGWTYKESFTGYPEADIYVTRPEEALNVIECWEPYTSNFTEWPNVLKSRMYDIKLTTRSGTPPPATFKWQVSGPDIITISGKNTVIINNSTQHGIIDFYMNGNIAPAAIKSGNVYMIVTAVNNSSILDSPGNSTIDGTQVILYERNVPVSANQKWRISRVNGEYFKIQPTHLPDKALTVKDGVSASRTAVTVEHYTGNIAQQWKFVPDDQGYYYLVPACAPAYALDVYNNETTNGKPMTISWYNGSVAQKFRMVLQASAIQPPNSNPLFPTPAGF
jgi:hypothetical protein